MPEILHFIAYVCFIWSSFVILVQIIGATQIFRFYTRPPPPSTSASLPAEDAPHVTIIRPVKGLEPRLYACLASTFRQAYPAGRLTVFLCVESAADPAYPVLRRLLADFPDVDARVLLESEDPLLHGRAGRADNLGPNPKIRNISRAYREAPGDLIWIIDCNVWVSRGTAGRMVDKLCGFGPGGQRQRPYKFVHQLPLVVDVGSDGGSAVESEHLLSSASEAAPAADDDDGHRHSRGGPSSVVARGGGRLEEMFMATTHAKFYSAINTVGVAPCIVGKSNMFRRSHLERITSPATNPLLRRRRPSSSPLSSSSSSSLSSSSAAAHHQQSHPTGVDFFSANICEDHLIGDLLWRSAVVDPDSSAAAAFRNHGLVLGDLAVQPMAGMSVPAYAARRVRWLRVRKWTVLVATLVEPGVESLLCALYLAFGLTTAPYFAAHWAVPPTWAAAAAVWLAAVAAWMLLDWHVYNALHADGCVELDADTPSFARPGPRGWRRRRPFGEWLLAWVGREVMALPIWTYAVLLGTTVTWRGKRFRVGVDMRVKEIVVGKASVGNALPVGEETARSTATPDLETARPRSKDRQDRE